MEIERISWQEYVSGTTYLGQDYDEYDVISKLPINGSSMYDVIHYVSVVKYLRSKPELEEGNDWIIIRVGHWAVGSIMFVLIKKDIPISEDELTDVFDSLWDEWSEIGFDRAYEIVKDDDEYKDLSSDELVEQAYSFMYECFYCLFENEMKEYL